ncbi:phosphatase PAP2 family protein [Mesobacillus zeae]|uniref:Phosphatase PAP2 family protein n=1 Tax=Mesobacillus zeae TaxID=1917180 RepID=A0A398B5A4_9BACI|nr:phosphatase PAP2 family protein [Mesobacillus zeae]RID84614.1 phosphatase PAP2 family protein [Mesobacillus zeae]
MRIYKNRVGWTIIALAVYLYFSYAISRGLPSTGLLWMKLWHGRPRPEFEYLVEVKTSSYPSDHAMAGLIMFMMAFYFIKRPMEATFSKRAGILATAVLILLLGISRIALNVHFPSNVAGGYAAGFIWSILWIYLYEKIKDRRPAHS